MKKSAPTSSPSPFPRFWPRDWKKNLFPFLNNCSSDHLTIKYWLGKTIAKKIKSQTSGRDENGNMSMAPFSMVTSSRASHRLATCIFHCFHCLNFIVVYNHSPAFKGEYNYRLFAIMHDHHPNHHQSWSPLQSPTWSSSPSWSPSPPPNLHWFKRPVIAILVPGDFNAVSWKLAKNPTNICKNYRSVSNHVWICNEVGLVNPVNLYDWSWLTFVTGLMMCIFKLGRNMNICTFQQKRLATTLKIQS